MSSLFSSVAQQLDKTELSKELQAAGVELAAFVDGDAYVGDPRFGEVDLVMTP
jgi:hypothetical protein